MRVTLEIQGLPELAAKLQAIEKNGPKVVRAEVTNLGKTILAKTIPRTPKKTGALRDSGQVYEQGDDVIVGFGGNAGSVDVNYAVYVHERLDVTHPVGQAKFLEITAVEEIAAWKPGEIDLTQ